MIEDKKIFLKVYSYALVISQFLLIILLVLNSSILVGNLIYLIIVTLGILLGVWAILIMKKSKIRVMPDIASDAKLVQGGPYKFIRHPMYSAVLIVCVGLLLSNLNILGLILYSLLILVLYFKINYEEKLLSGFFTDYNDYILITKRIIPYIY